MDIRRSQCKAFCREFYAGASDRTGCLLASKDFRGDVGLYFIDDPAGEGRPGDLASAFDEDAVDFFLSQGFHQCVQIRVPVF